MCQTTAADQLGAPLPVGPASRVVALAPDVTELAFALGLGSALVAAPDPADYPADAARLPRVNPSDPESIIAFRPDLVLATTAGNDPRLVERLRDLGIRVFTADVTSCERLADAAERLERVLDRPPSGLAQSARGRCAAASARAAKLPEVGGLFVVWWDPLIVAAPGTFHDDLLRSARLVNLAPSGAGRYPRADVELLLDPRLRFAVTTDEPAVREGLERARERAWGAAIASGRIDVIELPADPASRPGPRLPDALEALVRARQDSARR